jgi:hypothetical protein
MRRYKYNGPVKTNPVTNINELPEIVKRQVYKARQNSKPPPVPEGQELVAYGDDTQVIAVEQEQTAAEIQHHKEGSQEQFEQ